jgi:hypothetical protein
MQHKLSGVDEELFRAILAELIDENAFACRAVLSLAGVSFDERVPTLAVSLTKPFTLRVNLAFVSKHCQTEDEVRAVILHEFLHVLLGHTDRFERVNSTLNIALDATINAMIHRTMGRTYSAFFRRFYRKAVRGSRLLRPPILEGSEYTPFHTAWDKLYKGQLTTDDVLALLESMDEEADNETRFIGGHEPAECDSDPAMNETLAESWQQFQGAWPGNTPAEGSMKSHLASLRAPVKSGAAELWERTALRALRKVLTAEHSGVPTQQRRSEALLPILNQRDRRSMMRAMWSPILPKVRWETESQGERMASSVYLDVSGSMAVEMTRVIGLLERLLPWIRRPFWAFSTEVAPADIRAGVLQTETTGGTDLNPVLRHIAKTGVRKVLIVTDGYVGECDPKLLKRASTCQIHVLITRNGTPHAIQQAGLPYTQLDPLPSDFAYEIPWGVSRETDRARPTKGARRKLP